MRVFDRFLRPKGKPRRGAAGWTPIKGPRGQVTVRDPATLSHMQSTAPQPTQTSLNDVLETATRAVVYSGGVHGDSLVEAERLFEASTPEDIEALRRSLRIVDGGDGHCMCLGDIAIEFFAEDGRRLVLLGVHHGRRIRWEAWKDDARLEDGKAFLIWIASKGARGPLDEFMEAERREEDGQRALERWNAAIPDCLRLPRELVEKAMEDDDPTPFLDALAAAYPRPSEQAKVLLEWYGNGAGPWSGAPAYEQFAEILLQELPESALIEAARSASEDHQLEGAARFFAERMSRGHGRPRTPLGHAFMLGMVIFKPHPERPASLPEDLRRKLLEYSMTRGREENRERARVRFS